MHDFILNNFEIVVKIWCMMVGLIISISGFFLYETHKIWFVIISLSLIPISIFLINFWQMP